MNKNDKAETAPVDAEIEPRSRKADHVVFRYDTKAKRFYLFECLHCGTTQRLSLPISVDVYIASSKAFANMHRDCKPKA